MKKEYAIIIPDSKERLMDRLSELLEKRFGRREPLDLRFSERAMKKS